MAHQQLRFKLLHRVQHHADHDQQARAGDEQRAGGPRLACRAAKPRTCTSQGKMATTPRNSAPTSVMRPITAFR
jgi:hypothetical protein